MPESTNREPLGFVRKLLPFMTFLLIVAALYVAWIFYSRWQSNRQEEQAAAEREVQKNKKVLDLIGSGKPKINSFIISPGIIAPGQQTLLCYSVINAKTVKLEPQVAETWPSMSRCFHVNPKRNTRYRLTVADDKGNQATESAELKVK